MKSIATRAVLALTFGVGSLVLAAATAAARVNGV